MHTTDTLIRKFERVQTLPVVVSRLTRLLHDEASTLQDYEDVISLDPTLVARLLTLVNSAHFGVVRKVDSISRAVALLGMKNLHNIALTSSLKTIFSSQQGSSSFSPDQLWIHCAACAICSKMIAERIFSLNGDDAYLCGIIHDIGLIIENHGAQKEFFRVMNKLRDDGPSIIELEQECIGTDHCRIGYQLARDWQLPDLLVEAIRDHHKQCDAILPDSPGGILQLSEYVTAELGYSIQQGVPPSLAPSLATHLQENITEYTVLAEDLPEEIEQFYTLYEG